MKLLELYCIPLGGHAIRVESGNSDSAMYSTNVEHPAAIVHVKSLQELGVA